MYRISHIKDCVDRSAGGIDIEYDMFGIHIFRFLKRALKKF